MSIISTIIYKCLNYHKFGYGTKKQKYMFGNWIWNKEFMRTVQAVTDQIS